MKSAKSAFNTSLVIGRITAAPTFKIVELESGDRKLATYNVIPATGVEGEPPIPVEHWMSPESKLPISLVKGKMVHIEGSIKMSFWQTSDERTCRSMALLVNTFTFMPTNNRKDQG
ncbi:MAG: hypothetical protein AAF984_10350 [Verrucomicrobiota bacterium]